MKKKWKCGSSKTSCEQWPSLRIRMRKKNYNSILSIVITTNATSKIDSIRPKHVYFHFFFCHCNWVFIFIFKHLTLAAELGRFGFGFGFDNPQRCNQLAMNVCVCVFFLLDDVTNVDLTMTILSSVYWIAETLHFMVYIFYTHFFSELSACSLSSIP